MTGDLMLNLSRTQQSSGLLPKYQKKVDSLRYNNHHIYHHHNHHNHHHHNSVPTSPNEMLSHRMHKGGSGAGSNSASTSPVGINSRREPGLQGNGPPGEGKSNSNFGYSSSFVRTSRSEDHLQFQKDPSMSAVDIDIDDDVTSSLNTLLDTRPDSGQGISSERIVWTYNAPVSSPSASERTSCCQNGSSSQSSSSSRSSTEGTSPQRSLSPASPTSVSSSVMSSNSGSRRFPLPATAASGLPLGPGGDATGTTSASASVSAPTLGGNVSGSAGGSFHPTNGDLSQSEAISNMSSPDYNDEETMDILSARDIMMVSDPSDSDSTILASEPPQRRLKSNNYNTNNQDGSEHRIVIQVKGPDKEQNQPNRNSPRQSRRRGNNNTGITNSELVPPTQSTQRSQSVASSGNVTPEFVGYQVFIRYDKLFYFISLFFFSIPCNYV